MNMPAGIKHIHLGIEIGGINAWAVSERIG